MIRPVSGPVFGLTALELLLIASIIAILSAVSPVVLNKLSGKSELHEAVSTVEESVTRARQTAMLYHTEVIMRLETKARGHQQYIVLSIPAMRHNPDQIEVAEAIELPHGFRIDADRDVIHFAPDGQVDAEIRATIVSNDSEELRRDLLIF